MAVLKTFESDGFEAAQALANRLGAIDKRLVLTHAMIAAMQGEISRAFVLQRLAH